MKVDYRMQYYDVITNPRWRMAANVKVLVMSALAQLSCLDLAHARGK